MAGQTITHKAGDTFRRSLVINDVADGISAGMAVNAVFVRGPARIEINSTVIDDAGTLKCDLEADAATSTDWLPGLYQGDVSFGSELTTVDSTVTISMLIERGYF